MECAQVLSLTEIEKLKLQRELCEKNIDEYEKKIKQTKLDIKKINNEIRKACPSHNWKTEREPYMYGEKFTYCTVCGSDYYP